MTLNDDEFAEMLALCDPKEIPADLAEARRLLEKFCDLIELLVRPTRPTNQETPEQEATL